MITKKRVAMATVVLAAVIWPVAPFEASAGSKRTYRCMNDFYLSNSTVSINAVNLEKEDVTVKWRYRNAAGAVTFEGQSSIPSRGAVSIGGAGTEGDAVVELTTSARLALDGFVYHEFVNDDHEKMRAATCR